MKKQQRMELLMDSTMKMVARHTLVGLTMRQISAASGVNQSLIYRDFGSKDKLLRICFDSEAERINDLIKQTLHEIASEFSDDLSAKSYIQRHYSEQELHAFWHSIIPKLIKEKYRILYFFEYREYASPHYVREDEWTYSQDDTRKQILVMDHVINAAIQYAKRVIRNLDCDSREKRDMVWRLLSDGVSNIIM